MFNLKTEFKIILFLIIMFTCFYALFIPGSIGGDGYQVYLTAKNLVLNGKLHIAEQDLTPDLKQTYYYNKADGHHYFGYGMLQALIMIPFYIKGLLLSKISGIDQGLLTKLFVNFSNCLITAFIIAGLYILSRLLNYSIKISIILGVLAGITTMLWNYSKESFSEPLSCLLFIFAFIFAVLYKNNLNDNVKDKSNINKGSNKYIFLSSIFLGLSLLTKIANIIFIIPLLIYFGLIAYENKKLSSFIKAFFIVMFTILFFMLVNMYVNKIRFGSFLHLGYIDLADMGNTHVHIKKTGIITVFYGFLLSSGRSIFVYNPVLIAALFGIASFYKKFKKESYALLSFIIISFLLFSSVPFWYGGLCWGPRYLYPLIPFLMLPLGEVFTEKRFEFIKKRILPLLVILGILIQIPSVMANYFCWDGILEKNGIDKDKLLFVPAYSQVAGSIKVLNAGLSGEYIIDLGGIKENLSEYASISPCIIRGLKGSIEKQSGVVIHISTAQRVLLFLWMMFLIFMVFISAGVLYRKAKYS
ncbi:MAG: hypothetical protein ABIH00_00820 [Armatimonadota bacterium]